MREFPEVIRVARRSTRRRIRSSRCWRFTPLVLGYGDMLNRVVEIGARSVVAVAFALAVGSLGFGATAASLSAAPGAKGVAALDLLSMVPGMLEHRGDYDRGLFPGWVDANRDGCDMRAEVLRRESRSPVRISTVRCTVVAGDWLSLGP